MKSRDGKYTVDKTKNATFRVRFYCEKGIRRGTKVKTATERDILIRAIKRMEELDYWFSGDDAVDSENIVQSMDGGIFGALAEDWLNHGECVREISESCLMNYRSHLRNHILPQIGDLRLRDMSLRTIENLASHLKKQKPQTKSYRSVRNNRLDEDFFEDDEFLSTAYRREILTVVCMITKYGFERGLIAANPFSEYRLPETPEQPYDFWRIEEEDKFLQWLEDGGPFKKMVAKPKSKMRGDPQYFERAFKMRPGKAAELHDVVLFALRSGLRKGEIGALRVCDVNFANNLIVVRRSWSEKERRMKNTTKSKSFRRIEMNEDMKSIIKRRILRTKSDQDLIFDVRTWAIKNFSKYCRKAGVREIHFHSLRHTCLTNLANGYGMDKPLPLPQVQQIAGHKDPATTMRYVHTNGIESTTSLQWSREKRKSLNGNVVDLKVESGGLRLVAGGTKV